MKKNEYDVINKSHHIIIMYKRIIPTCVLNNKNLIEKTALARGFFKVEEMLGRPFKRFNLLVSNGTGLHFSSSNDYLELIGYIENHQRVRSFKDLIIDGNIKRYDFDVAFKFHCEISKSKNRDRFFMFINLRGENETYNGMTIENDDYVGWSE